MMIAKSGFGLFALFSLVEYFVGGRRRRGSGLYFASDETDQAD